ncbi:DMT family transporter [Leeia oryzae]|uniref:DMT family transporter n=1 Tax=Leeia oryzae TaxID=356662 RepID=UPI000377A9A3|nr:DMT family transporter [Leeia oryzae]
MIYLKLILTTLFWGGSFIAAHVAVGSLPPMVAAWLRFLIACICLFGLMYRKEGLPSLSKQQLLAVFGLGVTGILAYNYFFFKGLSLIPASRAALLVALNPILTVVADALIFRRRLALSRLVGVVLSLVGTVWVVSQGNPDFLLQMHGGMGELIILGACLSWVAYTMISKLAVTGLSPLTSTTLSSLIGFVLITPFALNEGLIGFLPGLHMKDWYLAAYLAIPGTVLAFSWYAEGIKAVGAQRTIIFTNLVPVFGVLLSVILLGEHLSMATLLGGCLTVVGVFLTNRPQPVKAVG